MSKILLVCYTSPKIGLGHLSRLLALAQTLKKDKKVVPEFLIFGNLIKKDELGSFVTHNFSIQNDFSVNNDMSIDEFKIKLEEYAKNNSYPKIDE